MRKSEQYRLAMEQAAETYRQEARAREAEYLTRCAVLSEHYGYPDLAAQFRAGALEAIQPPLDTDKTC